jgi:hypothetical protein
MRRHWRTAAIAVFLNVGVGQVIEGGNLSNRHRFLSVGLLCLRIRDKGWAATTSAEMINAVRFVDFCTGDPRRRRG